ncbi:MAG: hypothetical protein FWC16_12870 [Defluviitaleaceae bacterium]|nr:hypothetical protein [Defluviitaleaceae bacterium]MCL2275812.1 hypothetical protein [Defluviitaleaceae bacterium]
MITTLVQPLINAGNRILDTLPLCPFVSIEAITLDNQTLAAISWFIPFNEIIALLNTWLAAIVIWYAAKTVMRWAKMIS